MLEDSQSKVTLIPFYGGGKGQSLQIIEKPDGTVVTNIIQTFIITPPPPEEDNTSELENPPLPTKQEVDFGSNINQKVDLNLTKLQQIGKKYGSLNVGRGNLHQKNMDEINNSSKKLAQFQEQSDRFSFENREGLSEWFESKKSNHNKNKIEELEEKKGETKKEEKRRNSEEEVKCEQEEKKRKEKPKEKQEEEEEEEEKEEGGGEGGSEEGGGEDADGIAIGSPPDDVSVAEAKPVGLAVAGEGGVAASKPIATAVVGPGGLAIARPVGTAIAGVAPDKVLVPSYAESYIAGTKPKRYGSTNKPNAEREILNKIIIKYHQY